MSSIDNSVAHSVVGGACGIRYVPDGLGHKIEFYVAPSTEGEKKGAEFGKKYFGETGEKIFATLGYLFGPADEEKNKK